MDSSEKKNHWIFLPWLIAAAVGGRLIARTFLITKDGPTYIEQAKRLAGEPIEVIKGHSFGYPAMILATHKIAAAFGAGNGVYGWIIPTQIMTLCCLLAAMVFIYYIGRNIVGKSDAFIAILILVFLPYPFRFAADVLREWPSMMILTAGLAALVAAGRKHNPVWFALAGLAAGMGYLVRAENVQIVVYGLIWLGACWVLPRLEVSRKKIVIAAVFMLVCFAIIVLPYMYIKGQYIPAKLDQLIDQSRVISHASSQYAGISAGGVLKSLFEAVRRVSENLMYYFFVFLVIGLWARIKDKKEKITDFEKIIVPAFFALNIIIVTLLFYNFGYMSRRHCLAMSVVSLFYVPGGLRVAAVWLEAKLGRKKNDPLARFWFTTILLVGICICVPALIADKRSDRAGFLQASRWLRQNTAGNTLIAVPDLRISFYAGRTGIEAWKKKDIPDNADYAVAIVKKHQPKPDWGVETAEFFENQKSKDNTIVIYRTGNTAASAGHILNSQ